MTITARPRFVSDMLEWLNRRLAPPGVMIDADTPLFRTGIINSIRILELIAWTERATGRTILDRDIRMDNFQSVGRIADVFVEESHVAG
jgi:acyl carrier protein